MSHAVATRAESAHREKLFRLALVLKGMSASQFARAHHVSAAAMSRALTGNLQSRRLNEAVNRTIKEVLPDLIRLVALEARGYLDDREGVYAALEITLSALDAAQEHKA